MRVSIRRRARRLTSGQHWWRLAEDKVRLGDMGRGLTEVGAEIVSGLVNSLPKTFQKSKFTHLDPY